MKALFGGTYEQIEDLALFVRDRISSKLEPAPESVRDCLRRTVGKFRGTIETIQDPSDPEKGGGSLVIYGPGNFVIWLSPYQSPLRANFTIGHELGHYILHYKHDKKHEGGPVVFNRFGSDAYEWQANRFAASFLMPREEYRRYHEKFKGNPMLLAGHFGVSESAVEVRRRYALK
jgi:hypothetical protein